MSARIPEEILEFIQRRLSVDAVSVETEIQELWSGYGSILRLNVELENPTVIVKIIQPPVADKHPRGWNTSRSRERKIRSYQVESCWYSNFAEKVASVVRLPECYGVYQRGEKTCLILEDLDPHFPIRRSTLQVEELGVCLEWLANFHAHHMNNSGQGLWETGTYWHLATRPDEFQDMEDGSLKRHADALDQRLSRCRYQTLVHGDAKVANFCFSRAGMDVAMVDFQYTGKGCGMKDLVYFIGSCLSEEQCELYEQTLLDAYFDYLRNALATRMPKADLDDLCLEWRSLYAVAWADFHRFLLGWMPGHHKINDYSRALTDRALAEMGLI